MSEPLSVSSVRAAIRLAKADREREFVGRYRAVDLLTGAAWHWADGAELASADEKARATSPADIDDPDDRGRERPALMGVSGAVLAARVADELAERAADPGLTSGRLELVRLAQEAARVALRLELAAEGCL